MDLITSSSLSTLQNVTERMKEKINGTLKAAKLQTFLAARIKAKNLYNSSILKVSLKYNNRALACALSDEKEKARKLENDKMFLQKEVKMLHFQNALLRQNLCTVNKMLKDIDLFMNVKLPAAIELSRINESSDLSATEEQKFERFSCQSSLSLDEHQEFRLNGMPLRVPSKPSERQKFSSVQGPLLNENAQPIASLSPNNTVNIESADVQHEMGVYPSNLTPKECLSPCNWTINCDSLSKVDVCDFVLPQDKDVVASSRSGRYVTKRRKGSTVSHSSTLSMNSDINQSKISVDSCRESLHSTQFDINKDNSILSPELGQTNGAYEDAVHNEFGTSRNRSSMSCLVLPCYGIKESLYSHTENVLGTTDQPILVHSRESELRPDYCSVEQEQTMYEADVKITSSDSVAVVAILPKNKSNILKSGIPRKQDGSSLRKVKITSREKTKNISSYTSKESNPKKDEFKANMGSGINVCENMTSQCFPLKDFKSVLPERYNSVHVGVNMNAQCSPSKDFKSALAESDTIRTCVSTKSVNQDEIEVFENEAKSDPKKELPTSLTNCIAEDLVTEIHNLSNKKSFAVMLSVEEQRYTNETACKRRKTKVLKECSKYKQNVNKKQKITTPSRDQELTGEDGNHIRDKETLVQMNDSMEAHTIDKSCMKYQEPQIRRKTYIVGSINPNSILCEFVPKDNAINYRRETFVIPDSNSTISAAFTSEEKPGTTVHYFQHLNTSVSTILQPEIENISDMKKGDSGIPSHCLDMEYNTLHDYNNENGFNCPVACNNKGPSLFFQENKNTNVLPAKEYEFRSNKDTPVHESFVNVTQISSDQKDSFMLDMVSESILDKTLACPSFTTAGPDSTYVVNVALDNISLPPNVFSDDCNTLVSEQPNTPKSAGNLDESDSSHAQEEFNDCNLQCKVKHRTMEINKAGVKAFQNLSNKTFSLTKASLEEEEGIRRNSRRKRNPVNYKEPSLGTKLRRDRNSEELCFKRKGEKRRWKAEKK